MAVMEAKVKKGGTNEDRRRSAVAVLPNGFRSRKGVGVFRASEKMHKMLKGGGLGGGKLSGDIYFLQVFALGGFERSVVHQT